MPSVLLVDDDPDFRGMLCEFLQANAFAVEECGNGIEALECLDYGNFDLVVMDWSLPGMDGIDVCRQHREKGGTTPVLLLTGNAGSPYREESKKAGATDYLIKPVNLKDLVSRIRSALSAAKPEV